MSVYKFFGIEFYSLKNMRKWIVLLIFLLLEQISSFQGLHGWSRHKLEGVKHFQEESILTRNHGVYKYNQISYPHNTQHTTSRPSTRLYLFDRFIRVVMANFNSLLKRFEDPEKIIEQAVVDMQNDLVRVRQSYAEILASLKRMERQKDTGEVTAKEWLRRAELAVEKDDESLAAEALHKRHTILTQVQSLTTQIATQRAAAEKLSQSMQLLEQKIGKARQEKDLLIARAKTAKTAIQVNEMISNLPLTTERDGNALDAFDKMKNKVEALEVQVDVSEELLSKQGLDTSTTYAEKTFQTWEEDNVIAGELQALKAKRTKRTALPPGNGNTNSFPGNTRKTSEVLDAIMVDDEYERLRKEIRGK